MNIVYPTDHSSASIQGLIDAADSDDTGRLIPAPPLSLEQALAFIGEDECVEVTPTSIRLRKAELDAGKGVPHDEAKRRLGL